MFGTICMTFLFVAIVKGAPLKNITNGDFEIVILHNNDMHARFEETSKLGGVCRAGEKCYGGFARVAHLIREERKKASEGGPAVLYLNAGDTYQGSAWFTLYKWNITYMFMNILQPDAISLGNHEFDDGVSGLVPFLNNAQFPVLACNLNLTNEPTLQNTKTLNRSHVFEVQGHKIGVIGYLTPDTRHLSALTNVEYLDEVPAIRKEAQRLQSEGVNILIALGHSGYETDLKIAKEVSEIDLVIGGHTNTFLYNGKQPDVEIPVDLYPSVVNQESSTNISRNVPVVQAYAFTKYLGRLHITFDSEGEIKEFDGQPILLNEAVPQEQDVLDLLEVYRPGVKKLETPIGHTKVLLDGNCRMMECNLGNMIADSMVYAYNLEYEGDNWTDAGVAIIQGGGIRTTVDAKSVNGVITKADILGVLPFKNTLRVVELTGQAIKEALEWSVHRYVTNTGFGEFLQVAGLKVTYNLDLKSGQRVADVEIRCADCLVPMYQPLDLNKSYRVLISNFLQTGGDGFKMFTSRYVKDTGIYDIDALETYIKNKTPIYPGLEGRITAIGGKTGRGELSSSISISLLIIALISGKCIL